MIRLFKLMGVAIVLVGMAACSSWGNKNALTVKNYQTTATSLNPVQVPPNLSSDKLQSAYPIPPVSNPNASGDVSLVPPGSDFEQYKHSKKAKEQCTPTPAATTVQAQPAIDYSAFTVKMAYEQAWAKAGSILAAAGYQIMEKDKSLGNYYVLDKTSTGGKLKRDTPIYQVHLEKTGDLSTAITLLDDKSRPLNAQAATPIYQVLQKGLN